MDSPTYTNKKFLNLKFSAFLNFADGFVISSKVCLQLGARKPVTKHKFLRFLPFLLLEMHFHEKMSPISKPFFTNFNNKQQLGTRRPMAVAVAWPMTVTVAVGLANSKFN